MGASLGGVASLLAVGESDTPVAGALVLVDVAPRIEPAGAQRIGEFMTARLEEGYGSLEEVADAIAVYNPHRPRPNDLSGLEKIFGAATTADGLGTGILASWHGATRVTFPDQVG